MPATVQKRRCAVYTRVSTDEGLKQEYNSLDAQRDSAEKYIASQAGEGWVCLPDQYDDGGFTGGNMERPALQRLLADIAAAARPREDIKAALAKLAKQTAAGDKARRRKLKKAWQKFEKAERFWQS